MATMNEQVLENVKKTGRHKTADTYEGAYYMSMRCRLIDKEIVNERVIFCFEGENIVFLVKEWIGGSSPVKAQDMKHWHLVLKQDITKFLDDKRLSGNIVNKDETLK